jgi:fibronectin type 3 domain-containing protein
MQQMHTARKNAVFLLSAVVCGIIVLLSFFLSTSPAAAVSLTIGSGVTVQSGPAGQLVVRDTLKAGQSTLTSGNTAPAPGDWLGLLVFGSATGLDLNGTIIRFAGAALDIRGGAPVIAGTVISDNSIGIMTRDGAHPQVQGSSLAGNVQAVTNLDPAGSIAAGNNWWGHPSGPRDLSDDTVSGGLYNPDGLGSPVSDGVIYSPWAAVVPLLGTSFAIAEGNMTETSSVTLNLACATCTEFMASESPQFTGAAFQPFVTQYAFPLSSGDALKTIYVRYRASTGNTGGDASASIRLDTVGPALAVSQPPSGSSISRPVTIIATASDPAGVARVEFYVDNILAATDTTNSYSFPWNVLSVPDGGHELKTVAVDTFGHATTDIRTVTVSKAPPAAPVITDPTSSSSQVSVITVTGTAEPNISVSLYINGNFAGQTTATAAGIFRFQGVQLVEGSNNLTAAASDTLGSSPKSAIVAVAVDTGPPGPPRFYSSVAATGGGIKLSWTPDIAEIPASYNLYRSPSQFATASGATRVGTAITATSYTDLPAADGLYFYGLTAVDASGNESALSPTVSVFSDRTPPSAVVEFIPSAPAGPGTVAIKLVLSEALASPPYLGIAPAGDIPGAVVLNKTTETEWTGSYAVTPATPHGMATVLFAGKDLTGNKGSQITSGSLFAIDTKGPVGSLQISPTAALLKTGVVALSLTLDEPASLPPGLQFTAPAGVVTPIALTGSGAIWSGTMTVTSAMGDGTGSFAMTAVDSFGNSGSTLTSGHNLVLDVTPPSAPSGLTALTAAKGNVQLTWNTAADAASYRVYRGTAAADTLLTSGVTVGGYLDLPAADGSYHYGVTAVDAAGNESPLSNAAIAVSDRIAPTAPAGLTQSLNGTTVQLSWNTPAGEAAASYRIYRATTAITSITGLSPLKAVTGTSASDIPVADATYHYAVTALDAAGNESAPSVEVSLLYNLSPPTITVAGISDQQYSQGTVTPIVTVTSASSTTQIVQLDGQPFTSGTAVSTEGSHLLHIEATDTSTRTTIKEVAFTIDLTDPVVSVTGVAAGTLYDTAIAPIITAADANLDKTLITLNGVSYLSEVPITSDGPKTLRVEAVDRAGRTTVVTVGFTIDTAPPPPATLSVTATQGGSALLEWGAAAVSDLSGYLVYRNGVKLTAAPQTALTYADSAFAGSVLQTYEVSAVDATGHESAKLTAHVLPVQIEMKNYGRISGTGYLLSRNYIESLTVSLTNGHSAATSVGPIIYELRDGQGRFAESIQSTVKELAAGATVSSETILPSGSGIVDNRTCSVTITLPAAQNVTVKRVAGFSLNVADPGRRIEIFNEPIIKGAVAKVRLKIFNHGSVPMELLTSSGTEPSPDISVVLKDQDGNVLVKGNLNQKGAGVSNYSGYALAEVPPGGSFLTAPVEMVVPSTAPDKLYVFAYVNNVYYHYRKPDQVTAGNFSDFTTVTVGLPAYTATVASDQSTYDQKLSSGQNTPVIILSGTVSSTLDQTPVPDALVKIGIGVKGFARYLYAMSDSTGHYSTQFVPLVGEAGNYSLWATHPDVADKPVQSGFTIYGLGFEPRTINLRMSKNSSFSTLITLKNPGEADLSGLQFSVAGAEGLSGSIDTTGSSQVLAGGAATTVRMTLNAALNAPDAGSATVTVTTAEGINRTLEVSIALLAALPTISTDPAFIEVGVNRNNSKVATFKLKNVGYAPLENISIQPPALPWIGLLSPVTLPNLAPGASTDISVNFRPTDAVAQGPHADKLVITSGNHVPYTLNLFPTVSSTNKGSVHFQATNALNKRVPSASVVISHQLLGNLVLSGKTDVNGELSFLDITEGMYSYKVQAPGHEIVIGTFEVVPDVATPLEIFMNNVFVTYEWSVTPMTIIDKYDVKLVATYETQVPAPVLVIDPAYEKLELERGSTYIGEYRVTNHGMVALDDVKIGSPGAPGLTVDVLISELPRIGPQETVIIPYRITVNSSSSSAAVVQSGGTAAKKTTKSVAGATLDAPGCSTIPMEVNVGGYSICLFGKVVYTAATTKKTIVPKDTYDPFGLCDVECDWCKCIPYPPAAGLCSCVNDLAKKAAGSYFDRQDAVCGCLGMFGKESADAACACMKAANPSAASVIECAEKVVGGSVIGAMKKAVGLLDAFKGGLACGLCLADLMPAPSPGTYTGGTGGGGPGGMGSPGSIGIGFSGSGCK